MCFSIVSLYAGLFEYSPNKQMLTVMLKVRLNDNIYLEKHHSKTRINLDHHFESCKNKVFMVECFNIKHSSSEKQDKRHQCHASIMWLIVTAGEFSALTHQSIFWPKILLKTKNKGAGDHCNILTQVVYMHLKSGNLRPKFSYLRSSTLCNVYFGNSPSYILPKKLLLKLQTHYKDTLCVSSSRLWLKVGELQVSAALKVLCVSW